MIPFNLNTILIPVDFSQTSMLAVQHAAYITKEAKAKLVLLHVLNLNFSSQNMFVPVVNVNENEIEAKASAKLREFADDLNKEYGVQAETITRIGTPYLEIVDVAKEIKASLIVMGTHGYGPLDRIVIGSVAMKVLTHAPCPTMAMNSEATHSGYKKVVMPIDNTVNSKQKVNYTLDFAKHFGAEVHAVALLTSSEDTDRPALELVLHQIQLLADEKNVKIHTQVLDKLRNRADATVQYANSVNADLIVIMTDQDAELSGFFLGPYSQQIIHKSRVPVIAIKPKDIFSTGDFSVPISGIAGGAM